MTRMAFDSANCLGVESGTTGKSYDSDRKGFIHVDDQRDVKAFKAGGYTVVSGMPTKVRVYYTCDNCSRDSFIQHCSKCDSDELRRVED